MRAPRLVVLVCAVGLAASALADVKGVSPSGRRGVLHKVVKGDTLWDITAHYLGTPWIWPSIWKENEDIANPHLIYPGDLIWITDKEMRKVSPEEAEALLAEPPAASPVFAPEAFEDVPPPGAPPDPFAALDALGTMGGPSVFYAGLHRAGFVSSEELEAAAAVLGTHRENYWMAESQEMIVGAGEGHTEVGEHYTIFRVRRRVLHPETREPLGYFVEILGQAEVSEVHPETSYAMVTDAYSEIEPGDLLLPYEEAPERFTAQPSRQPVDGAVVAQQPHRSYSGEGDVIVLDRGQEHGLDVGRELIVYRPGHEVTDPLTSVPVLEPDDRIGRLFVLKAGPRTSLALVTQARTEVAEGDRFRSEP